MRVSNPRKVSATRTASIIIWKYSKTGRTESDGTPLSKCAHISQESGSYTKILGARGVKHKKKLAPSHKNQSPRRLMFVTAFVHSMALMNM